MHEKIFAKQSHLPPAKPGAVMLVGGYGRDQ
jgi:hypothetical protein